MPSIHMAIDLSFDSEDVTLESQSDLNQIKRQPESSTEKQTSLTSDHSNNPLKTNEIDFENKSNVRHRRFPSTDLLDDNDQNQERIKHNARSMDNILLEQKSKSGKKILFQTFIMMIICTCIHVKLEKYST